ncbi:hypothetical protein [Wolbachia endosymbiont of Psylliodes chrysocephala]|uniref:hypothetical protein n=1 Tax=Wolbachia endosymbiont of Psylliodes chrysocephala TaxID=2883236 RepID=UPI00209E7F9E|nr:hypothetical protein [Wolbachia endosymbiont of Psylliodes chrysocephala]
MTLKNYKDRDGVFCAISEGYKQADDYWGIPGAAGGFGKYAKNNKLKTTVVGGGTFLAVALIAAYFLSPAYAAFVGTVGTKAATLVSPAITAVSAFLVAHPLIASLIIAVSVAAVVTAGVFMYKDSNKASQIEKAGELLNGKTPASKIDEIKQILKVPKEGISIVS